MDIFGIPLMMEKKPPRIQTKSLVRLFCQIPSDGAFFGDLPTASLGAAIFDGSKDITSL
jgi:hypothetical protein